MTALEKADGATILRFDNAPVNALDLDLLNVIIDLMRGVDGPVVLTGAGRAFSAGVDLRALVDGGTGYAERFVAALSEAFLAIYDHPAPVVAAVNGHAIAGGCVLAMCADVRLMSGGTIGLTELSVGVPFPVAALEICRGAMGSSATRAALGAKTIDADTALARGWVDEVVGKDDLLEKALATARELGEYSPAAYAATKTQLHKPVRAAIDAGTAADADVRASWISDETRDRINAFLAALARGR
ncbi:enoyl-CoA hydratase [Mycobacterium sp. 1245111.1]|uniref:enoyl-CoA hydratase/isomerase family protein n=1 Tax=Mycobacterium sp. 1245111.1 TaxID=1834073 RepID=UPI0008021713|nr:enoyl-CoA hydratase/isomerase family protein [Mycobacterium sp. 1245111.1]OBK35537.1 enoyl-CoA hydratase [Mycobacterium sp. 1245111.1]